MPIDPVCGMEADESDEITAEFEGTTYYFCSTDCRDFFDDHPKRFVDEPHPHLSEASGVTVPCLHYGRAGGEFDLSIADPESLSVGDRVEFRKTLTDGDVREFAGATGETLVRRVNESAIDTHRRRSATKRFPESSP